MLLCWGGLALVGWSVASGAGGVGWTRCRGEGPRARRMPLQPQPGADLAQPPPTASHCHPRCLRLYIRCGWVGCASDGRGWFLLSHATDVAGSYSVCSESADAAWLPPVCFFFFCFCCFSPAEDGSMPRRRRCVPSGGGRTHALAAMSVLKDPQLRLCCRLAFGRWVPTDRPTDSSFTDSRCA